MLENPTTDSEYQYYLEAAQKCLEVSKGNMDNAAKLYIQEKYKLRLLKTLFDYSLKSNDYEKAHSALIKIAQYDDNSLRLKQFLEKIISDNRLNYLMEKSWKGMEHEVQLALLKHAREKLEYFLQNPGNYTSKNLQTNEPTKIEKSLSNNHLNMTIDEIKENDIDYVKQQLNDPFAIVFLSVVINKNIKVLLVTYTNVISVYAVKN
eukprot:UN29491